MPPTPPLHPIHPATPALRDPGGRRLLLLAYHFPPGQAAGVLRWQKLAGYAAERGWGLDVVTLHPDDLAGADPRRLADLPPGTRVWGVRRPPPRASQAEEAVRWVRRLMRGRPSSHAGTTGGDGGPAAVVAGGSDAAAGDELAWRAELRWSPSPAALKRALRAWRSFAEEDGWARAAGAAARALVDPARHDAVVSCGPPHMVHRAARAVARAAGLPLVIDLRDPWSLAPAVHREVGSPLWYLLAERFERAAVGDAALVVANTPAAAEAMRAAHPAAAARILAVMNGCDDEPLPPPRETGRFTVAYAGTVYIDRDPRALLAGAARVVREEGLSPERFGMEFIGHADRFGGATLASLAAAERIGEYVAVHPRRPRAEALEALAGARVLLSLPQGVEMSVPSKLFEYVRFPAWLLAVAAPGSATGRLLAGTGADLVPPGDADAVAAVLRRRFRQWAAGERPRPINHDGRFDRARQAALLLDALEGVVGRRGARRGRAA